MKSTQSPIQRIVQGRIRLFDERFRITEGPPSSRLLTEIEHWGCLVPPICVSVGQEGDLVPVGGFKRLAALAQLHPASEKIEVSVLGPELSTLEVLAVAAHEIRRDREITPFEAMRGISRAIDEQVERSDIVRDLLGELGLEPHQNVLDRHLKLRRIPNDLARWLESKDVSLRRALRFAKLGRDEAACLAQLSTLFGLSLRAAEEWTQMIGDTARRDKVTWQAVVERAGLTKTSVDEGQEMPPAKHAQQKLWALRYPHWKKAVETVRRRILDASLSERMRIVWDDTFETEGLQVHWRVANVSELKKDAEALIVPDRLKKLERVFESI